MKELINFYVAHTMKPNFHGLTRKISYGSREPTVTNMMLISSLTVYILSSVA